MKPPHYLRVTRALALVSTLAVPAALVTGCGGKAESTPGTADPQCSNAHPCGGGAAPYSPPDDGPHGFVAYDAGPETHLDAGISAYDGGYGGVAPYEAGVADGGPEPDAHVTGALPYDAGDKG